MRESVKDIAFVLQKEQLGTGHAVMQARPCWKERQELCWFFMAIRPHYRQGSEGGL